MSPKYIAATSFEELENIKTYRRSKCGSTLNRVEVPSLAKAAKSELLVVVKERKRHTIPSIYAQRLFMGPKYKAATSLEKLGSTPKHTGRVNALQRGSTKCQIWSCWLL